MANKPTNLDAASLIEDELLVMKDELLIIKGDISELKVLVGELGKGFAAKGAGTHEVKYETSKDIASMKLDSRALGEDVRQLRMEVAQLSNSHEQINKKLNNFGMIAAAFFVVILGAVIGTYLSK